MQHTDTESVAELVKRPSHLSATAENHQKQAAPWASLPFSHTITCRSLKCHQTADRMQSYPRQERLGRSSVGRALWEWTPVTETAQIAWLHREECRENVWRVQGERRENTGRT